ncbi:alpha/beta hydrolase, partial [uncultured Parabacteroides sp.]
NYRPNLSVLYYPVVDMVLRGYGFPEIKRDFEKISPIHHLSEATPSTLILLGTKDPIVSVETIRAYQDKLLQKGVDCELHLFEGAGHPIFLYRKPLTEDYYKVRKLTDDFLKREGFL